jgi:hypothetical protein
MDIAVFREPSGYIRVRVSDGSTHAVGGGLMLDGACSAAFGKGQSAGLDEDEMREAMRPLMAQAEIDSLR